MTTGNTLYGYLFGQKFQWLNSDKDMNIEYNDVKNIAAAEFAISRDIAMIDIQMHSQSND